jgi:alpha-aminoadipate carrier protein LysW
MKKTDCPVCDGLIELDDDVVAGELLECPDCGVELEIVKLDPLKVQEAPQEEEDWGE